MLTNLKQMSGEQLLLVRVFGGDRVQGCVDLELDRRAMVGRLQSPTKFEQWAFCNPRHVA